MKNKILEFLKNNKPELQELLNQATILDNRISNEIVEAGILISETLAMSPPWMQACWYDQYGKFHRTSVENWHTFEYILNTYGRRYNAGIWHTHPSWADYVSDIDAENLPRMKFLITSFWKGSNMVNLVWEQKDQWIEKYFDLQRGDVNMNGMVDVGDAWQIQLHISYIKRLRDDQVEIADGNGDGRLDIRDALYAAQKAVHII